MFKNGSSKICGRQPLKFFTWSILEYFASYKSKLFASRATLSKRAFTRILDENTFLVIEGKGFFPFEPVNEKRE